MISINIYEILMQMINFGILLWLINRFLIGPLSEFLRKRAEDIETNINEAQSGREEASKIVDEQKALLKEARVEASQIREKNQEAIQHERETILATAKKESDQIIAQAKKDIASDINRAKKELLGEIGELAVMLSERILKRKLDDSDKKSLVSDNLEKLKN